MRSRHSRRLLRVATDGDELKRLAESVVGRIEMVREHCELGGEHRWFVKFFLLIGWFSWLSGQLPIRRRRVVILLSPVSFALFLRQSL